MAVEQVTITVTGFLNSNGQLIVVTADGHYAELAPVNVVLIDHDRPEAPTGGSHNGT